MTANGIECLLEMAIDMVREADGCNKGFITCEELRRSILKASRLSRMIRGITYRWKRDERYQDTPDSKVFINTDTNHDVNRSTFAKLVESAKLCNDTRRKKPVVLDHTWSGLLIQNDEEIEYARHKTLRSQEVFEASLKPHADSRFRRLPLHFCCSNRLHPEAAVMVRDVLSAYELAAQVKDQHGCLALHIACSNESYMSASMVRLLLSKYPAAARVRNSNGLLPLHLCLMYNHGDGAFEIVESLLQVYPRAAKVAIERDQTGHQDETEFSFHLAMRNTSIHADKMITRIIEAYPEVHVMNLHVL